MVLNSVVHHDAWRSFRQFTFHRFYGQLIHFICGLQYPGMKPPSSPMPSRPWGVWHWSRGVVRLERSVLKIENASSPIMRWRYFSWWRCTAGWLVFVVLVTARLTLFRWFEPMNSGYLSLVLIIYWSDAQRMVCTFVVQGLLIAACHCSSQYLHPPVLLITDHTLSFILFRPI